MEKYNFYERNKRSIERLPTWSLETLVGCWNVAVREIKNLTPTCHPDYVEMLHCAKKEFEKNIQLKRFSGRVV
jgi:hypothetical protein